MAKPKKGDILIYTGQYASEVTKPYGKGEVVAFRNYGETVTVRLIEESEELYADWPVEKTEKVKK